MPHKHKRGKNDNSTYDLPPTAIAKPLPARDPAKKKTNVKNAAEKKNKSKSKPRSSGFEDDTPKAFARLMEFQKTGRIQSGLDDGTKKNDGKKRKRDGADDGDEGATPSKSRTTTKTESNFAVPKILPGEKLSDYSARVNMALPLSGVKKSKNPASADMPKLREERQTKHERHLRRLQREWREEDAKIREREAAEREEKETEMEEQLDLWKQWETEAGKGKAKKKAKSKKKKKGNTQNDEDDFDSGSDDDGDPWAKLKERDRATRPANPFEVVQAPPQLTKPRAVFKVRGTGGARVDVANVPNAAGSLRRREELAGQRRSIVEEYRRLMAEKRQ